MRIGIIVVIGSLLSSCNSNEVSTVLAKADSVEVRFANTQNDQLSHNTSTPEAVQKLAQLASGEAQTGPLECPSAPAGIILFFEKGKVLQAVMFSDLKAKCRYFITKVNDKTYHTPVTDEAVTLLQGIQ